MPLSSQKPVSSFKPSSTITNTKKENVIQLSSLSFDEYFEYIMNYTKKEDMLNVWMDFLLHVSSTYADKKIVAYHAAIVNLSKYTDFYNNDKLVSIWFEYASLTNRHADEFQRMLTNGVGQKSSMFYEGLALWYEQKGDNTKADSIYVQGMDVTIHT